MKLQHISLASLCERFGVSRQAYYQDKRKGELISIKEDMVIKQIEEIRKEHPSMGVQTIPQATTLYASS